jgi:tetrapyrrole methylase family protein/MazG family protein
MTLHVVGLGPGSPELLTRETADLLASGLPVILRTRHHPTVEAIDPGRLFATCDDLYQSAASFEDVYSAVVERVLAAARSGDTIYAVPGHPLVAERTVTLLLAAARAEALAVVVHPAISYADLAAVALGVDIGTVQLCDALDLRVDTQRPALISQLFDRDTTTALKLRLLDQYPTEHRVTVLTALGTVSQSLREVALHELDHRPFGYLDCLYLPAIAPIDDVRRFDGLAYVIDRLHAPDGCPWDREQTHESLRPHLLEESYEALEAIDAADPVRLTEELGDVLLQVLMHAAVARRQGTFSFADVAEHIARKLIRRHPHVFGEAQAKTSDQVYRDWEVLKRAEKPTTSILEGVPATLPALAASQSLQGRARRVGFDWPDIEGPLAKLVEEVGEFARADTFGDGDREDEFGDILFVVANIAQRLDIDAEQALRRANEKFRRRFGAVERLADERHLDLKDLDLAGLDALWDEAKATESAARL